MNEIPMRYRLCPPHFKLQSMRVDSPTFKRGQTYERDLAFFKANPHRNACLRLADMNEFDLHMNTVGEWLQMPQLHVLVTKITTGIHLVAPVYRGKAFFPEVSTDHEIAMIVADMAKLDGIDIDEFEQFERKHNAQIDSPKQTKNGIVH